MSEDERDAFDEGYRAGWEFHLGSGVRQDNPHQDATRAWAWDRGFAQAGDDS